jgi:hypothetical protein
VIPGRLTWLAFKTGECGGLIISKIIKPIPTRISRHPIIVETRLPFIRFHPVFDTQLCSPLTRFDCGQLGLVFPKLPHVFQRERCIYTLAQIAPIERDPAAEYVSAFLHSG